MSYCAQYDRLIAFQERERVRHAAKRQVADEQRRQLHAAVYAQSFALLRRVGATAENAAWQANRDADAAVARMGQR
jgi:uncharacterized membrane protein